VRIVPVDSFVVNGGDLLQRWTNDRWLSAVHRVKKPVKGSAAAEVSRQSITFFTAPRDDAIVTSIPGADGEVKYAPITCREHVQMKIARTNA
jgi:isopenicillin N synthase-like dioxygenase